MASTLLDILNNGTSIKAGGIASADAETNQLLKLAQAKTGKVAASTSAPKMSNIGAQSAAATGQAQAQLQNQQFEAKGAQLVAQEGSQDQQFSSANQQLTEQKLQFDDKLKNTTDQLIQDFNNKKSTMTQQERQADAQQIATAARLTSEKYIEKLEREGALSRLGDQQFWEEEYYASVFGANTDLLKQKLGNADWLNIDENDFKMQMGEMDLDTAMQMAYGQASQANKQAKYTAVGKGVTAVADYYSDKAKADKDKGGYDIGETVDTSTDSRDTGSIA